MPPYAALGILAFFAQKLFAEAREDLRSSSSTWCSTSCGRRHIGRSIGSSFGSSSVRAGRSSCACSGRAPWFGLDPRHAQVRIDHSLPAGCLRAPAAARASPWCASSLAVLVASASGTTPRPPGFRPSAPRTSAFVRLQALDGRLRAVWRPRRDEAHPSAPAASPCLFSPSNHLPSPVEGIRFMNRRTGLGFAPASGFACATRGAIQPGHVPLPPVPRTPISKIPRRFPGRCRPRCAPRGDGRGRASPGFRPRGAPTRLRPALALTALRRSPQSTGAGRASAQAAARARAQPAARRRRAAAALERPTTPCGHHRAAAAPARHRPFSRADQRPFAHLAERPTTPGSLARTGCRPAGVATGGRAPTAMAADIRASRPGPQLKPRSRWPCSPRPGCPVLPAGRAHRSPGRPYRVPATPRAWWVHDAERRCRAPLHVRRGYSALYSLRRPSEDDQLAAAVARVTALDVRRALRRGPKPGTHRMVAETVVADATSGTTPGVRRVLLPGPLGHRTFPPHPTASAPAGDSQLARSGAPARCRRRRFGPDGGGLLLCRWSPRRGPPGHAFLKRRPPCRAHRPCAGGPRRQRTGGDLPCSPHGPTRADCRLLRRHLVRLSG